jgi:hypothetical protein
MVLVLVNGAVLAGSALAVLLLLAATPAYGCGRDYASPPTPLHSGRAAIVCFLWGAASLLVAIGLRIGTGRRQPERGWATRAIWTALAILLVAGIACVTVVARWTCWP